MGRVHVVGDRQDGPWRILTPLHISDLVDVPNVVEKELLFITRGMQIPNLHRLSRRE